MMKRIGIILLNYKNIDDTIECITSLYSSLSEIENICVFISVVDNNSNDASYEVFKKNFPQHSYFSMIDSYQGEISNLIWIQSFSNNGFAAGCNIGIKFLEKINCDYFLLLNNDTIVYDDFLSEQIKTLNKIDNRGICSAQIYSDESKSKLWFSGGRYSKISGFTKHMTKKLTTDSFNNTFCSGAVMLIPLSILKQVGYLDESFFMYNEDLEYSQRVLKRGFTIAVSAKAEIYHKVGAASHSSFSAYWISKNRIRYLLFYRNDIFRFLCMFILIITRPLSWIRFIKNREFSLVKAQIKGLYDGLSKKDVFSN